MDRDRRPMRDRAKYGVVHKTMRARLAPVVAAGKATCARCGELIEPDTPWQLDHRDDDRGWLGPSHASCNQRAGWEKMVASNSNGDGGGLEEQPYKWSQRWFEDPPPGTTVNLGDGLVEMYLGRGIWQTVPTGSHGLGSPG